MRKILAPGMALLLAGCGHAAVTSARGAATADALAQSVTGELLVKFRPGQEGAAARLGLTTVARIQGIGVLRVKAADPTRALAALQADPAVLYAEPNAVMRLVEPRGHGAAVPRPGVLRQDDELLPQQWDMAKIGAPEAWAVTTGKGVKVAVVDTGIDYHHLEFGTRVDPGKDFTNSDPDGMDDLGHGTHCAGTIGAGRGNGGMVGVAPDVTLLSAKVIGPNGSGNYGTVAAGITWAADSGAAILSISLAGSKPSQALADAVKYATDKGCLVVAAMGNEGSTNPDYPAACPGAMPVGATSDEDTLPNFTNCGPHLSVVAPGVQVMSTFLDGGYETLDGTSMATPHVAGLAALLKSQHPSWTPAQLRARIEGTADDKGLTGYDIYFGHGRINAARAVKG